MMLNLIFKWTLMSVGFVIGLQAVTQPLFEPNKQSVDYFDLYLNRKLILQNDSSTGSVCFRSTFLTKSVNESYILDNPSSDQHTRKSSWILNHELQIDAVNAANQQIKNENISCPDFWLNYIYQHKLPAEWKKGTPVNELDEQVIFSRRIFEKFDAANTKKGCCMAAYYYDKVKRSIKLESSKPVDNDQFEVTVLSCMPLEDKEVKGYVLKTYCLGKSLKHFVKNSAVEFDPKKH